MINLEHPIITDAMEFLKINKNEIDLRIKIALGEKLKIWYELNPQNIIELYDYYDNNEVSFYDTLQFNTWSNAQKPFVDFKKYPIKTALEFGCGCGSTALYLAEQGFEVTIADINEMMLDFTSFRLNKYGYNCNKLDLSELKPLKTNYDLVTTIDVLEHVINPLELIIHFRDYCKFWYSTALKPKEMPEHLGLWKNDKIIDIIKSIGWNPIWLAGDEGRGFFE